MCTQLQISSPGAVRGEDTQVIFHQPDGRGNDADQSQHVVQTRVQSDAHKVTQQSRKRGKRRDFEGLRGRGGFRKRCLDFFSLPTNHWLGGHKQDKIGSKIADDFKKFIELTTSI